MFSYDSCDKRVAMPLLQDPAFFPRNTMDHGRHATTAMIKNGYPRKWIVRQLRCLQGLVEGRELGSPPCGQILEKDVGAVGHPMSRRSPVGEQTAYPGHERKKWLRAAALATLPCQCVNERPTCTREGAYRSQFQNCQTSRFLRRVVSRGRRQPEPGRAFEWFEIVRAVETRRAVVR